MFILDVHLISNRLKSPIINLLCVFHHVYFKCDHTVQLPCLSTLLSHVSFNLNGFHPSPLLHKWLHLKKCSHPKVVWIFISRFHAQSIITSLQHPNISKYSINVGYIWCDRYLCWRAQPSGIWCHVQLAASIFGVEGKLKCWSLCTSLNIGTFQESIIAMFSAVRIPIFILELQCYVSCFLGMKIIHLKKLQKPPVKRMSRKKNNVNTTERWFGINNWIRRKTFDIIQK